VIKDSEVKKVLGIHKEEAGKRKENKKRREGEGGGRPHS
jgi:hypothetical protein